MFKLLLQVVFTLITKLFSLILSPILAIVTVAFPDLANIISACTYFLTTYVYPYVAFSIRLIENFLGVPHWIFVFLFDYLLIKYTCYLTIQAIKFGIACYQKFKP